MADPIVIPNSLDTMGHLLDEGKISDALGRSGDHDPSRLNLVAAAVTDVLGYTRFSRRYAIAVLVLEALERVDS